MDNILRAPLCSWGSFWLFHITMFFEGALKWSGEPEGALCANWSWGYVLILSEVSILYLVWLIHLVAIGYRSYCGIILIPWLPSDKGAPTFLEGLLHTFKRCPKKSSTWILFTFSLDKKGLGVLYLVLSEGFFLPHLLLFCRRGKVKIEVNKKLRLDLLFRFLFTDPPCHVVTLKSVVWSMPWAREMW